MYSFNKKKLIWPTFVKIGTKFRDEPGVKYGLLRCREFIMKDLYTFDTDEQSAARTYEEVNEIYAKLFKFIGVPFVKGKF